MSLHLLTPPAPTRRLRDTDDLVEALGIAFSAQQLDAITAPLEPGVIIAGAGSGKTTVMAARVVWLVGTGAVRPEEVLGLTFTRKAAAELSARVRAALLKAGVVSDRGVDESGEQLVMTYDAFAARLVSEHGLRLGYEADPTMVSGATRYRLASRVVKAAAGPFEFLSRLRPATVTERVLKLDAELQSHLVAAEALDAQAREMLLGWESAPPNRYGNVYVDVKKAVIAAQERLELASLVLDYQELKRRLGLVEFADQMAIAARLAEEVPQVSASLRAAFRVVLLDEYQDTSAAQAITLRHLFSGPVPSLGLGHPVTAVGDPFQAIYGWRGAAASNILGFAGDFPRADRSPSRRFALTVNRRSGQSILDVANELSRPLRSTTLPGASGDAAQDGLGLLLAPEGTPRGTVRAATFDTWPEEVRWIGDQIVAAHTDGRAPHWADIAVLTRRNADIAPLYAELSARDVPVEIVGLGGLLHLPEVVDVTATLRLVNDVTANPDLIRLLGGPRWQIGPRDLALLGRRARDLARGGDLHRAETAADAGAPPDVVAALSDAVAGVDPTEVVSLLDALENPGDAPYSAAARERFARLAAELAYLRRHSDEPLLDLTRRIIVTLGLDVELVATREFEQSNRRDQLGTFLDAVADYVDVDGEASLSGLLAYFQAEIDQGAGLEQAVPSDREAVKLLTVHKAKGLEWEVVFLPALMKGVFPSDRVTDNWVTNPAVLPADLRGDAGSIPQLDEASNAGLATYKAELTRQQLLAEDRLAYVAATRARQLLVGTGHYWRADLSKPRTPSGYLQALLAEAGRQGEVVAEAAPSGPDNPLITAAAPQPWPKPLDPDAWARRQAAAGQVEAARRRNARTGSYEPAGGAEQLLLDAEEVVAGWDSDTDKLLAELAAARSGEQRVLLPESLSATSVLRLTADPDGYAADLARPMPRPPSRAARFGTRFHSWVEHYFGPRLGSGGLGQQQLVDPDDLPDRVDGGTEDETELRELCEAFVAGRFGASAPYAVEAPFSLLLGGRLVRGRIDAVYRLPDDDQGRARWQVVDWKTSRLDDADPLQLALYRLAWAEVQQVPLEQVDAVFYHVRSDQLVHPRGLGDRATLEALLLDRA
ncbi:DNA helicase-2 / ATP-dependent DNA helicase PcrA [Friedmanniella luteola]|uniref:DNA 3'-5' helicase n=1 Tax=Friedmanniella luteola TaxID=546871 RepID=A0A1H1VM64_9ACTN|nr:ATP-dependent DNA helicase [Friedmanniella luteola]SDS85620.1 DNA helicase-2 / ATP-dependent DNA helicase PcrA [Friedmanniella luteola]